MKCAVVGFRCLLSCDWMDAFELTLGYTSNLHIACTHQQSLLKMSSLLPFVSRVLRFRYVQTTVLFINLVLNRHILLVSLLKG